MARLLGALLVATSLACARDRWQPYFQPDGDPQASIVPSVTLSTLLECQQYLHLRFANLRTSATLSCYRNCHDVDPTAPPQTGYDRLGTLDCPRTDRQIVGQVVPIGAQ